MPDVQVNAEATLRVFYPHWEDEYALSEDGTQLMRVTSYEFDSRYLQLAVAGDVDADEAFDAIIAPVDWEPVEPSGPVQTALFTHVRAALELLVGIRDPESEVR